MRKNHLFESSGSNTYTERAYFQHPDAIVTDGSELVGI
jgi:hypothetical protein